MRSFRTRRTRRASITRPTPRRLARPPASLLGLGLGVLSLAACSGGGLSDPDGPDDPDGSVEGRPALVARPARLAFWQLFPGERASLVTFVVNTGEVELTIREAVVTRGLSGEIRDPRFTVRSAGSRIAPGEALPLEVGVLAPADPTAMLARLRVFFREPSAPVPEVLLTASVIPEPGAREEGPAPPAVAGASAWWGGAAGDRATRDLTLESPPPPPAARPPGLEWEVVESAPPGLELLPSAGTLPPGRRELRTARLSVPHPLPPGPVTLRIRTTSGTGGGGAGPGGGETGTLVLDSLVPPPSGVEASGECGAPVGGDPGPTIHEVSAPVPNPYPPEGASPSQDPLGTVTVAIRGPGSAVTCDDGPEVRFVRTRILLDSRVGGESQPTGAFLLRSALCDRLGVEARGETNGAADPVGPGGGDATDCALPPGARPGDAAALVLEHAEPLRAGTGGDGGSACAVRSPLLTRLVLGQRSDGEARDRLVVEVHASVEARGPDCSEESLRPGTTRVLFLTGRSVYDPGSGRWLRATGDADADGASNYAEALATAG